MAALRKILLKTLKSYKKVVWDIVIFGSIVKDKQKPNDIDVAVVFSENDLKLVERISAEIGSVSEKIHYNWIFLDEIGENPLWMTLMLEGFSVKTGKKMSELFGCKTGVIFSYSLVNLENKSKFSHALTGRNGNSGKLDEVGGEMLAKGAVFVPAEKSDSFRDFLNYWKADYKMHKVIIV